MKMIASSAVLGLSLAACAGMGPRGGEVVILNPELRVASADHAATMAAARSPLMMASGMTVSTCGEYLAVRDGDGQDIAPAPDNRLASLEYVVCDSLSALRRASPVATTAVDAGMGEALATRLDLRSFRSSWHQRTTDEAYTLQAVADHPLTFGPYTAELDTPDWYYKLEVVAVADVDASGRPDWLIWVVDQSRKGTYLTVAPLLIHDPAANGLLQATPLPR